MAERASLSGTQVSRRASRVSIPVLAGRLASPGSGNTWRLSSHHVGRWSASTAALAKSLREHGAGAVGRRFKDKGGKMSLTESTESPVLYDVKDRVAWVTLNRVRVLNALNGDLVSKL